MSCELLLEIGAEEIPAGYIEPALGELKRLARAAFKENRIKVSGDLEVYGTPRRLVLIGHGIADRQEDRVQELTGPPKRVAYDNEGRPTKAAVGFAQKQGVSLEALGTIETSKGEYLFVKKQIAGRDTRAILSENLPQLIASIPWPKSMRWGRVGFPFARPIHWVLALLEGEVIPFEVAGLRSGDRTRGHRFMAPEEKAVSGVPDYLEKLKQGHVLLDQRERERMVKKIAEEAAASVGGTPADDPDLVAEVANLVEYPSAVCGSFDEAFLSMPDAVLITAMREHQRYFAVYKGDALMPHFVAINNTVARDEATVQRGHERVLRARLSDADFFFKEDRKQSLGERLEDLKSVIYQAELGTSYAKIQRFRRLAAYLCDAVLPDKREAVMESADLCKNDLITEMVGEFPSLQGVMGEIYARLDGHPEEVCCAIREHYLPARAGGDLPESAIGAVVGCADRMDTIAGIFAIGQEPTGSADPFALRRHALAILRIIEGMGWKISLEGFVGRALSILAEKVGFQQEKIKSRILDFFRERYKQMMLRGGYETDLVEAVISAEFDRADQLRVRMDELRRFSSESEEFPQLALTFKRVKNILKKQDALYEVDPSLFKEACESRLWESYASIKDEIEACIENGHFYDALELLSGLREPVDAFFEGVEVLTKEDAALRQNRVGVLQHAAGLLGRVADFSKFSI